MKEIELKCWITEENKGKIEGFLKRETVFLGKKEKIDTMFSQEREKGSDAKQKIAFRLLYI